MGRRWAQGERWRRVAQGVQWSGRVIGWVAEGFIQEVHLKEHLRLPIAPVAPVAPGWSSRVQWSGWA
jgi:hypothetical protein